MKPCNLRRQCPCGSAKGLITPSGNIHPAKLTCFDCGRFLKWLSKSDAEKAKKMGLITNTNQ